MKNISARIVITVFIIIVGTESNNETSLVAASATKFPSFPTKSTSELSTAINIFSGISGYISLTLPLNESINLVVVVIAGPILLERLPISFIIPKLPYTIAKINNTIVKATIIIELTLLLIFSLFMQNFITGSIKTAIIPAIKNGIKYVANLTNKYSKSIVPKNTPTLSKILIFLLLSIFTKHLFFSKSIYIFAHIL